MQELKIPVSPFRSFSFLKRTKKLSAVLGCFLIVGVAGTDGALSKDKDEGSVTSSPADELFVPSEKDIQESGPPIMIPTAGDGGGSMGGGDVETITIPGGKRGTMGGGDVETIDVPSGGHDVETITVPGGTGGSWQQPGSGGWSPPASAQPPSWSAPVGAGQGASWQQWSDMVNKTQGQPAPSAAPPSWGGGAPAQTWGTPPQGWNAASPPANWNASPPANWNAVPNGPPSGWGAPPVTAAPVAPPAVPPATAAAPAITAPAAAPASPDLGSTLLTGFLNWAASAAKPAAAATGAAAPAAPATAGTPATGSVLVPAITVPAITLPAITLPAISLPADIPGAIANSMKNMAPKTTPDMTAAPAGATPPAAIPPVPSGFPPAANGYPSAPPGYPVPPGFAPSASGYPPAWGPGQPIATDSPWSAAPGAPPKPAGVADDIMDTPLADSLLGPGGQRNLSSPNAVGRGPARPAPSLLDNVFGSRGLASPGANGMINYLLGPRGLNTGVRLRLR